MRIAVVGSGISGLGVTYALLEKHDVKLFERNKMFGALKAGNFDLTNLISNSVII